MSRYQLTPPARRDLADIRGYYVREAGQRVARKMLVEFVVAFGLIARNPRAGHVREDLAGTRRFSSGRFGTS